MAVAVLARFVLYLPVRVACRRALTSLIGTLGAAPMAIIPDVNRGEWSIVHQETASPTLYSVAPGEPCPEYALHLERHGHCCQTTGREAILNSSTSCCVQHRRSIRCATLCGFNFRSSAGGSSSLAYDGPMRPARCYHDPVAIASSVCFSVCSVQNSGWPTLFKIGSGKYDHSML